MRGKHSHATQGRVQERLIPTHAGKTPACPSPFYRRWAHPHSRRENGILAAMSIVRIGSSPLTRGKRQLMRRCPFRLGLIPAHAGKTLADCRLQRSHRAHPRSRGENPVWAVINISWLGSSPLTRGKLARTRGAPSTGGLIPAHAGKTAHAQPTPSPGWVHPHSRGENSTVSVA